MCKHDINFSIDEIVFGSHLRTARNGHPCDFDQFGNVIGYNEMGDISHYVFTCNDCGKTKKFATTSVEKPRFLKMAIDILYPSPTLETPQNTGWNEGDGVGE